MEEGGQLQLSIIGGGEEMSSSHIFIELKIAAEFYIFADSLEWGA